MIGKSLRWVCKGREKARKEKSREVRERSQQFGSEISSFRALVRGLSSARYARSQMASCFQSTLFAQDRTCKATGLVCTCAESVYGELYSRRVAHWTWSQNVTKTINRAFEHQQARPTTALSLPITISLLLLVTQSDVTIAAAQLAQPIDRGT